MADIPIAHLSYHASRYGKIAIGFHRDAMIAAGFNPVFYCQHQSHAFRALHHGIGELETIEPIAALTLAESHIAREFKHVECEQGHPIKIETDMFANIGSDVDDVLDVVKTARKQFEQFLAFVKTFDFSEFSTIYCEREWRSTADFTFSMDNVAMIVLPKTGGAEFSKFVDHDMNTVELPRSVPVVPWEDLIEH